MSNITISGSRTIPLEKCKYHLTLKFSAFDAIDRSAASY